MSTNAMWWVTFEVWVPHQERPYWLPQTLSLMSPDLADTRKATRRATDAATARMARQIVRDFGSKLKFRHTSTRCVG